MGGRQFTGRGAGFGIGAGCGFGIGWGFGGAPIGILGMGMGGGCGVGIGLGWGFGMAIGAEYLDTSISRGGFDGGAIDKPQHIGDQISRGFGQLLMRAQIKKEFDPSPKGSHS